MTNKTGLIGDISDERLLHIWDHSFQHFHVKGFDYVCLSRTPSLTRKVYFFDGDVAKAPEVVNPHNHRYDFSTRVLCGVLRDHRWTMAQDGERFNMFNWNTPLNGGDGFAFREEVSLRKCQEVLLDPQCVPFHTSHAAIHTIQIAARQTAILLEQRGDTLAPDEPSQTFIRDRTAPSLDGLYEKFSMDGLVSRLGQIAAMGVLIQ